MKLPKEREIVLKDENDEEIKHKMFRVYHDETLVSWYRRCSFSPDGAFFVSPTGTFKQSDSNEYIESVYVFSRNKFKNNPFLVLTGFQKPTVAVRFSPIFYELIPENKNVSTLSYRCIFAVLSQESVFIYDTQSFQVLAIIKDLHYSHLTDLAWSNDGQSILISSNDGFVSLVSFQENELGSKLAIQPEIKPKVPNNPSVHH
ncbi:hypothetical protein ROZALSC1DRAFT_30491 [Rozella allomycis CSF55]|uniref:CAF1B/HIR1 beta-propeller domain-containing protein n=1 Tax=Rozella allomycis (strain CSF55) TaxID=988480 RepID=A0A4P9YEA0_ROZAC|nr:hypothetical protein ROZALSC1DRAFT_30491 [Rozella allomycis CSF55]